MQVDVQVPQPTSHPFTCNTCRVAFRSGETQRSHMQSDWHRYNLKRRIAALTPLTAETFAEKVISKQADAEASTAKSAFEQTCDVCTKSYASVNAFQNHLSGQRHKQNAANGPKAPRQSTKPTGPVDPLVTCLFCNVVAVDIDQSVAHMKEKHGMYIPEKSYLVNLPGLVQYLYSKIQEGCECLFCGVQKRTGEACQSHMIDRGHCMIAYTTEDDQLEIGDYYDFRATYSDPEGDDDEMDENDDDTRSVASWETTSDCSVHTEDIGPLYEDNLHTQLALSNHHNLNDPRPHKTAEGFQSHAHPTAKAVYYDDVELHLPSGLALGHRKFRHIWRQRLIRKPEVLVVDDAEYTDTDADGDEDAETRLTRREKRAELFSRGQNTAAETKELISRKDNVGLQGITGQDRKVMTENIKRSQRRAQTLQSNAKAAYERKGNFQKHFRDPLLQ